MIGGEVNGCGEAVGKGSVNRGIEWGVVEGKGSDVGMGRLKGV